MSLHQYKMSTLGDKIREKAKIPEEEVVLSKEEEKEVKEVKEVEVKIKKGRRLNK